MIAMDRELLAAVVGGADTGGADTGGTEDQPPPNREETEGYQRIKTPLFDTGWDTSTFRKDATGYTRCLELMPKGTPPAKIRRACGTPNNPRF